MPAFQCSSRILSLLLAATLAACGGGSVGSSGDGNGAPTAPTITTQPSDQHVVSGQTAAFSVVAGGTTPLSYQWTRNGTAIAGATASSYTTAATTTADDGARYVVTVTNGNGSVTSNPATLSVSAPPVTRLTISGTVTGAPSATLTLSGASAATTTTIAKGTYSFTSLAAGAYVVTPSLAGYAFTPASRSVTLTSANAGGIDFTAAPASSPTGWPLEVLSWDLTRAYPGLRYEWRLGVKGGAYPYTFSLAAAPSGMSIDARTGVISWQATSSPSSGNAVSVRIADSGGASLVHSFTIDVTTSGFFFVDGATGADTKPGTLASPWATITHALTNAGGGIVYVRAGTYDATGFGLEGTKPNKWLAYPGERPILDLGGGIAGVHASQSVVSGFELRNAGEKMFWVGGEVSNLVWRKNVMHGVSSVGANNPAFIFFEDAGDYRPIEGRVQYDRIVVQENTFYDLTNDVDHGASLTAYNVKNLLFEDNEAYRIDGRGVSDKDDGYDNTFRHNVLHDMGIGVILASQYTQGQIEVCYNLVYDCASAVEIGSQPGYIRDVFVHHNTLVGGGIGFGVVTDGAQSTNLNVFANIIENVNGLAYAIYPVAATGGGYRYPSWVGDPSRARIDRNLVWTAGSYVAGYSWGLSNKTVSGWNAAGYDLAGVSADPGLGPDYSLPAGSPYRGVYGRDL